MGNAKVAYNRSKSLDTQVCFPCSTLALESSEPLFVLE